jgi:hypothetical protein
MARTAWHPGFWGAIQLELDDYRDVLTFEAEHQLTSEPLKIDVVIIKKLQNVPIRKIVGRIFQTHNVIEYKSPADSISLNDYKKAQCYSLLYAAIDNVDIDDMSVSLITARKPRQLLGYLEKRFSITSDQQGIYVVKGGFSPTQIIVSGELPEEENLWLTNLNKELTAARLTRILTEAAQHGKDTAVGDYINVVTEANAKTFQEVSMGKELDRCLKELGLLDNWVAEGKSIGRAMGEAIGEARGEAKFGRNAVLKVLRKRFTKIPKKIETAICQMNDPIALDSLNVHAATCQTLDEFAEALN